MITPELLRYIKNQLAAGVLKADIQSSLISGGTWNNDDIAAAFRAIETAPTQAQPAPPPVTSPSPTPTPAPVQAPTPIIPAAPQPAPKAALVGTSVVVTRRLHIMPALLLGLLVLIGGGVGYALASGNLAVLESYIPFLNHAPYDKTKVLSGVAAGLSSVHSSAWDVNLHLYTQARDADAEPLPVATSSQMGIEFLTAFIPANFDLNASLSGAAAHSGSTTDTQVAFSADLASEDLTMSLAAEFRKVGDNVYAIITKIPGLFGSFSALKNQWIEITPNDEKQYLGAQSSMSLNFSQQQDTLHNQSLADMRTVLSLEEQDSLLASANPKTVTLDGQLLYEYDLTLNASALPTFYQDAMTAFAHEASTTLHFDEQTLEYLQGPDGKRMADYLQKNLVVSIWADSAGIPHKFAVSLRLVPGGTVPKLASKQVRLDGSMTLSSINEAVSITAPGSSISFAQAYKLVTGQDPETLVTAQIKSRDVRRFADLLTIELALEEYHSSNNAYPSALSTLTPKYLSALPTDPLDKTSYYYARTGTSYSLKANFEKASDVSTYSGLKSSSGCPIVSGRICFQLIPR